MRDFQFTSGQRKRLAGFGASPKQIEMLEGHACLVGSAWLRKSPRRTVVSKKIAALKEHLRAAHVILEEILAADAQGSPEAEGVLCQALCRSGKDSKLLDPAGLEALASICDEALAMLPIQTRHRDADPRIIQWIYEDLIAGHGAEHYILRDLIAGPGGNYYILDDGDDKSATGPETPPFMIKPSSSDRSTFREIARVCYEAMTGNRDADPERAIRAFIKQRSEQIGHQVR